MTQVVETLVRLVWKDLACTARRPIELSGMLVFAATAAVVVAYATLFTSDRAPVYATSLFLIPAFISMFVAFTGFIREVEEGTLNGLRVSPVGGELIFFSKLLFSLMLIGAVTAVYELLTVFFTGGDVLLLNPLLQILTLSYIVYLAATASLASSMLIYSSARSILVPVVLLVLVLPVGQSYIPLYMDAMAGIMSLQPLLSIWVISLGYSLIASALSRTVLF
ncbi:MAG TPA: hypothetical protein EYP08_06395 [Pyrodictiaceae archaeon]|nr:hypothetical protein [Pyrodictiaceae archaeon]HIP85498.1 hypothetical protein [Pyrodictium sp.]HIQ55169.1 hypothetical protein [Pyrodictium sp.]